MLKKVEVIKILENAGLKVEPENKSIMQIIREKLSLEIKECQNPKKKTT